MNFEPIATVKSVFTEKFGIPRQSGLCPASTAGIVFPLNRFNEDALSNLDGYSHLWVIFYFHSLKKSPDKAKIRPPRLGGNQYAGVFSSRSPYRPNPIGLSLVELCNIEIQNDAIIVNIANHDLLEGTPVLDIKPYISHDFPVREPQFGWQASEWKELNIAFSEECINFLKDTPILKTLIEETLQNDPRPAYRKSGDTDREYGMIIDGHEVRFKSTENECTVTKITR